MVNSYLAEHRKYYKLSEELREKLVRENNIYICGTEHIDQPEGFIYHIHENVALSEVDKILREVISCQTE